MALVGFVNGVWTITRFQLHRTLAYKYPNFTCQLLTFNHTLMPTV
jgi:hypothetical protein